MSNDTRVATFRVTAGQLAVHRSNNVTNLETGQSFDIYPGDILQLVPPADGCFITCDKGEAELSILAAEEDPITGTRFGRSTHSTESVPTPLLPQYGYNIRLAHRPAQSRRIAIEETDVLAPPDPALGQDLDLEYQIVVDLMTRE